MSAVIAVMAKAPEPGQAKTRLCPPLSPRTAADLARCFLLDTIERVRLFGGAERAIIYTPDGAHALFEEVAPDFVCLPQRGADLGARLAGAFDELFLRLYGPALIIGTDTPTLPYDIFRAAFDRLSDPRIDVVIGPTDDGGYYMIGLRRLHTTLFNQISWSSQSVFRETIQRVEAAVLGVALLPRWFDVDTAENLDRLARTLRDSSDLETSHTSRYLEILGMTT